MDTNDYWLGLYKRTATKKAATAWYDGNPSTYQDKAWAKDEPNEKVKCVRYTKDGFRDRSCNLKFYYTCKKAAGMC